MMRRSKLWAHNNFVTRDDVNDNMTPRQRFTFLEQEGRRNAERETQKLMETDEFKEWQKKERAREEMGMDAAGQACGRRVCTCGATCMDCAGVRICGWLRARGRTAMGVKNKFDPNWRYSTCSRPSRYTTSSMDRPRCHDRGHIRIYGYVVILWSTCISGFRGVLGRE